MKQIFSLWVFQCNKTWNGISAHKQNRRTESTS